MAIFGKDESEIREERARLRQKENNLQKMRAELESKELDIQRQEKVLAHASELLKASQAESAKERTELEKGMQFLSNVSKRLLIRNWLHGRVFPSNSMRHFRKP